MSLHVAAVHPHHRHGWWWKTLLSGFLLWVVTIVVTVVTQNTNLVPTIILLGSFLVPFTVVLFVIERVTGTISTMQLVTAFFVGGILGVLGASLLEANLRQDALLYIAVGFVEEFVKGVLLVVVAWRVRPKSARQGALLGATVGAGFAAFESAGYAFNAAITSRGIDLVSLLQTEVVRAILSPVGHVLWTAILGAVLFGAARGGVRLRWSWTVLVAYVGVSLLHGLWDSNSTLATLLAFVFTGTPFSAARGQFVPADVATLSTTLYVVGLAVVTAIGVSVLVSVLVRHRRTDRALAAAVEADPQRVAPPAWLVGVDDAGTDSSTWERTPPPHAH
ncbi:RsiW-degrading membrane proteinase PrsW (M82 family) [Curtobacterium luteum]|uniref:RsiW-degrading membrane proteinase PrsW (M82 family) n=1 Tax=Curtobacterium luteum TaxID=33881 RepID=A0ABS2RV17_9MICO|nr:PrsW family glutamic-type intramembrane protease [Curtobacterium luteum]MBM7802860.1 RsiW-degrading membrane proteinase PrsW (M82 family) [Curtobacterium luteum]NUU49389.1 PrsW family intramembrane metalloprotease [Curtobacterium luteum]